MSHILSTVSAAARHFHAPRPFFIMTMALAMIAAGPKTLASTLATSATSLTIDSAQKTSSSPVALKRKIVTLESGDQVVTETLSDTQPASASKGTFLLFNGLIYDLDRWDTLSQDLASRGYKVVRFAFNGQPENLRLLKNGAEPKFFSSGLSLRSMALDTEAVLNALGIHEKVHVVGLSYGASVASEFATLRPERVETTVLAAPLVVPLDSYDPNGRGLRAWLGAVRYWENAACDFYGVVNPWLCAAQDYWYDSFFSFMYENYLEERIKSVPRDLPEQLYKKAVFHLVRAVRDFDLRTYTPRLSSVHMIVAGDDRKELIEDQLRAWDDVDAEAKRSLWVFEGAEHALPDEAPGSLARVLTKIAEKAPDTLNGKVTHVKAK